MGLRIVDFEVSGLIVAKRFGDRSRVPFSEMLTVERMRSGRGVVLHTRSWGEIRVRVRRGGLRAVEDRLRRRGIRVVDCWGAIIAPTLLDFEDELARGPTFLRQSSDNG